MSELLRIDGSHGEGGGQLLRTALSLAAITGRELELTRIRAGRRPSGLAAQHRTAVRAAAELCDARVDGDALGSQELRFAPRSRVRTGDYRFDVADARPGGSAGSATLVLQTVLLPLALARGESRVRVCGGTHVPGSPAFEYVRDVWLPALAGLGLSAELELERTGWFPAGQGELRARIRGSADAVGGADLRERGALVRVSGRALAANLPAHIPQRMADRSRKLLARAGIEARIEPLRVRAACPGAGLFLVAEYERARAGFDALGQRGVASETVADEAVARLLAHRSSGACLDAHLADQLIAPLALAAGPSRLAVERASRHLETCAWLVEHFGLARVRIETEDAGPAAVCVEPVDRFAGLRSDMVRYQLEARGIADARVLDAMRAVRRHVFVPADLRDAVYEDRPLPIGHGQTISQPFVVALMTDLARAPGARRALDIGSGCGYQAAVLAELVDEVYTLELVPELAETARANLAHLPNVETRCGDGHEGWPEAAPFDVIIAACAARQVPGALIEQLAPGGRLVLPMGSSFQELVLIEKDADGRVRRSSHGGVAFVPMVSGRLSR